MKFVAFIFLAVVPAFATTKYVAQNSGTYSGGTLCNGQTAISLATFNSSTTNSPGDLIIFCGTLTGSTGANVVTPKGSGSSGNPITYFFDTGAKISAPYCNSAGGGGGCLVLSTTSSPQSWIVVDGGTPCGSTPTTWVEGTCNGTIVNTNSGTAFTKGTSTVAIFIQGGSNIEVRNLGIYNIYVQSGGDTTANFSAENCAFFQGSNISFHDITAHDVGWCWYYQSQGGDTNLSIYNTNIYNTPHCVFWSGLSGVASNGYIHDNWCHDFANWNSTGPNAYHVEGIHTSTNSGTSVKFNNLNIYNNKFGPNEGTNLNAMVFFAVTSGHIGYVDNSNVFNNISYCNQTCGNMFQIGAGNNNFVANNTGYQAASSSATSYCLAWTNISQNPSYLITLKNNACEGVDQMTSDDDQGAEGSTVAMDYNVYANCLGAGNCLSAFVSGGTGNWHTYQTAASPNEAHSTPVSLSGGNCCGGTLNLNTTTFIPNSSSAVRGAGTNLYSAFGCSSPVIPGLGAGCFDIYGNARPSSGAWDAGAAMFPTATVANPVFSPVAGTYDTAQTVSLSTSTGGATICWNVGSAPTTNGAGTCTSGHTYSGPFLVATSETIYAIATLSGQSDSSTVSAAYVISNFTWGSKSGSGSFSISYTNPTVTPVNPDNLYCPAPGCTPLWGVSDGPALLPTAAMNTSPIFTPSPGVTHVTANGTDFQNCLSQSSSCPNGAPVCGDTIITTSGATYTGNFTLGAWASCGSSLWLTITPSGAASLPSEGARYTASYTGQNGVSLSPVLPQFGPCYAGVTSLTGRPSFNCPGTPGTYTTKIITPNSSPAFALSAGDAYIRIDGQEITRTQGTGYVNELIKTDNIGVSNFIGSRLWCHGDENQDETNRCMNWSAASNMAFVDSYGNDFYCIFSIGSCTDSQVVADGLNTLNSTTESTHKLVNDFMESASGGYQSGGGAANTTPQNTEYRLNTDFKPLQWNPQEPSYNGGISGHSLIVKNSFENKNVQLELVEGVQIINDWGGFTQDGSAILITPKNQTVSGSSVCPTCFVDNVTIRYSTMNSVCTMGEYAIVPGDPPASGLPAGGNNWSVHDIVADNLLYPTANGCSTSSSTFEVETYYSVSNVAQSVTNASFNHNTAVYASTASTQAAAIGLSGPKIATGAAMSGWTFTNNIVKTGTNGTSNVVGGGITANCAFGLTTTPMINACFSTYTFGGNCFVSNGSISWPGTNVTSGITYTNVFTSYNNGNGGNYVVAPSSACKGTGTDGLDPGANLATIASVLAGNLP